MNKASKDLIDILSKNSPLAGRLADYEIVQLIGVSTVRAYGEKAAILKGGEPATSLMFLISGRVNIHLDNHLIANLSEGEIFGEAMFSEQGKRSADAVAMALSEVLEFDLAAYETLLHQDSKVALKCKHIFEEL